MHLRPEHLKSKGGAEEHEKQWFGQGCFAQFAALRKAGLKKRNAMFYCNRLTIKSIEGLMYKRSLG
jgi:hypothetical protein